MGKRVVRKLTLLLAATFESLVTGEALVQSIYPIGEGTWDRGTIGKIAPGPAEPHRRETAWPARPHPREGKVGDGGWERKKGTARKKQGQGKESRSALPDSNRARDPA